MAYVTNENITEALNGQPVYEILNAIRDEASPYFQRSVTEATMKNISNFGQGVNANPSLQNEFQTLLVNFVIPIAMSSPDLVNDFNWAMGEFIPDTKTLEEIAVDVIDPIEFDQYLAEDTEKQIFKPNVSTRFYGVDREEQYPVTISRVWLNSAFENDKAFLDYVNRILGVLVSSNERGRYKSTVALMVDYYKENKFYRVHCPDIVNGTKQDAENFIEEVEALTLDMGIGSGDREFNNQGFVTRTEASSLHLIITTRMLARFKLGVWAKVFNLSEAEFKPNVHVVKQFGDSPEIQAVLCDEKFFRIHPRLLEMSDATNKKGLYTTYYLTVFDTFACSDFKNAVVFTSNDLENPVYDVILPLSSCDVRRGGDVRYEYIVRQMDDEERTPVFTVEKSDNGVPVASGTKFVNNVLYVDKEEKNKFLVVKATVTSEFEVTTGSGEETTTETKTETVVGRAMVKVVK